MTGMYQWMKENDQRGFGQMMGALEQIASMSQGKTCEPNPKSVDKLEGEALIGYLESFIRSGE